VVFSRCSGYCTEIIHPNSSNFARNRWVISEKTGEFEITGQTDDKLCANGPVAKSPVRCRFFFRLRGDLCFCCVRAVGLIFRPFDALVRSVLTGQHDHPMPLKPNPGATRCRLAIHANG
jgi:hypothetical protein